MCHESETFVDFPAFKLKMYKYKLQSAFHELGPDQCNAVCLHFTADCANSAI